MKTKPLDSYLPHCPTPIARETVPSFLSRLAAMKGARSSDFSYDMGVAFKRVLNCDDDALARVAEWGGLSEQSLDELISWTGRSLGDVRMAFRGDVVVSRALRNPEVRGCPVCLREDAAKHAGPPIEAMAMRGDWQLRGVRICVQHAHPLVPLWSEDTVRRRFDIGARLREIEGAICSGDLDRPREDPTPYDRWLDQRLNDGADKTWLSGVSLFAATTICYLLGAEIIRSSGAESFDEGRALRAAHAAGFEVARQGEEAIRGVLRALAARSVGSQYEPKKAFGRFYSKLAWDYLHEKDFAPFRQLLREVILEIWPFGAGETVLGEAVPERRLHSLLTASRETGVSPRTLSHFLLEAGAIAPDDDRPDSRKTFDAKRHTELLKEIPSLVTSVTMRNAMGASTTELTSLVEAGVLIPLASPRAVKSPWRIADGLALVAELEARSRPVVAEDDAWECIQQAWTRSKLGVGRIIAAIRSGELTVGRREGVEGYHAIVVPRQDIDGLAQPYLEALKSETPGVMSAAGFGRKVGLRDKGYFLALVDEGHTPATRIKQLTTGRDQLRVTDADIAEFHRRFLTPTTISAEFGLHRNTIFAVLREANVVPFAPDGRDFGSLYLRSEAAPLFAKA